MSIRHQLPCLLWRLSSQSLCRFLRWFYPCRAVEKVATVNHHLRRRAGLDFLHPQRQTLVREVDIRRRQETVMAGEMDFRRRPVMEVGMVFLRLLDEEGLTW